MVGDSGTMFATCSVCLKFVRETQVGASLFRVCQQRMTAGPRTDVLKTRLPCRHDGRMPDTIEARTKRVETANVVMDHCQRPSSGGMTD